MVTSVHGVLLVFIEWGVLVIIYGPNRYVTGDNTCKYVTTLFKIKRLENNN